jgi:arylsulfatase A-like enzyme
MNRRKTTNERFPWTVSRRVRIRLPRWLNLLVVVTAGAVTLHSCTRDSAPKRRARHVILVSFDTTRRDHFGCYGNSWIQTPYVDALAAESILFTDCMTVASTTLASHTSLFTGKYPHSHGVPRNGFVVNRQNVMLTEILEEAGFTTAGFLASFVLGRRFDFHQGFDYFDQRFDTVSGTESGTQLHRTAEHVTDAVIEFVEQGPLPENLFLFVHYFDPHAPYTPPPPYDTMYGLGDGPHPVAVKDHPAFSDGEHTPEVQREILLHAGEVSYLDEQFGRLLDHLRERGILDEAILLVTSDHGENLTDAPGEPFNHGISVYEPEIRSVCMIRLPRAEHGGTEYTGLTASIDLLPTVTRFLQLPTPEGVEGEALDLLNLEAVPGPRTRFAEGTKPPWEGIETDPRWFNATKAQCVRRGSYKYMRTPYLGTEQLYYLSTDPREKRNLLINASPQTKAIAAHLREALAAWTDAARPLPTHFDTAETEETVKRLQELGYLGGDEPDSEDQ